MSEFPQCVLVPHGPSPQARSKGNLLICVPCNTTEAPKGCSLRWFTLTTFVELILLSINLGSEPLPGVNPEKNFHFG